MMKLATIGHNMPPDPIDTALAPFGEAIELAEATLCGAKVETEAQMKSVDAVLAQIKAAEKAVSDAEESTAKPIYDQWKAEKARYAPTLKDLDRLKKGLVAMLDGFKRELAAKKEAARKQAEADAWEATRKAQEAQRMADATDIDAQRAADAAAEAAKEAQRLAALAGKDTVKGMVTVTRYEITDHRALLNYIAKHAREDMTAFIEEWARRHHKEFANADGLRVWTEKVAR